MPNTFLGEEKMSKRYFIRVFSMDEEEGIVSVLNRKLKTRVGNLKGLAEELDRTNFYEVLGVEEPSKKEGEE